MKTKIINICLSVLIVVSIIFNFLLFNQINSTGKTLSTLKTQLSQGNTDLQNKKVEYASLQTSLTNARKLNVYLLSVKKAAAAKAKADAAAKAAAAKSSSSSSSSNKSSGSSYSHSTSNGSSTHHSTSSSSSSSHKTTGGSSTKTGGSTGNTDTTGGGRFGGGGLSTSVGAGDSGISLH